MEMNSSDDISNCEEEKMGDDNSQEESSWTFYIEGFMYDEVDDQKSCFSSEYESPSLVSDASSSAVKKFEDNYKEEEDMMILRVSSGKINNTTSINNHMDMCKENNFKKQKNKAMHDLEDTASSPVNSPKMSYMNQFMNHNKEKGEKEVSEVKRNINFGKGRIINAERGADYTDLKKRSSG